MKTTLRWGKMTSYVLHSPLPKTWDHTYSILSGKAMREKAEKSI